MAGSVNLNCSVVSGTPSQVNFKLEQSATGSLSDTASRAESGSDSDSESGYRDYIDSDKADSAGCHSGWQCQCQLEWPGRHGDSESRAESDSDRRRHWHGPGRVTQ